MSRFVFLEGPSGFGKTRLAQVMSAFFGLKNLGFTVHKNTEVMEFRGGIIPAAGGRMEARNRTAFLDAEESGRTLINFSELNTVYKSALVYWLSSEMMGYAERLLPEIPKIEEGGQPFYTNRIAPDTVFVADINPESFNARSAFRIVRSRAMRIRVVRLFLARRHIFVRSGRTATRHRGHDPGLRQPR